MRKLWACALGIACLIGSNDKLWNSPNAIRCNQRIAYAFLRLEPDMKAKMRKRVIAESTEISDSGKVKLGGSSIDLRKPTPKKTPDSIQSPEDLTRWMNGTGTGPVLPRLPL